VGGLQFSAVYFAAGLLLKFMNVQMDGERSAAMPAGADQEEQCAH